MEKLLRELLDKNRVLIDRGSLADYIPELSKQKKDYFGVCILDRDGRIYREGDWDKPFTIQSIGKTVALALAVIDRGETYVFDRVGYYGTHSPFNSFEALERLGRPLNPMMNAGAIAVTSMIRGDSFKRYLDFLRYITKNDSLDYDREVYRSESSTGHRNRGIFYLMKNNGLIDGDIDRLEDYFKQCSVLVNSEDLAKIGYFFANNLVRFDGDRSYENRELGILVKSIMLNCGMYDSSGEFMREVGIPSKSGVGGGIMSAAKGMGIGVFGPALDSSGNSIAGVELLGDIAKKMDLSIF